MTKENGEITYAALLTFFFVLPCLKGMGRNTRKKRVGDEVATRIKEKKW
jgi:hypothetical protein